MLFDLGALWLIVWMLKNAAMDVSCAVTGKPNPRYELQKARARAAGQATPARPHYGGREWFTDLFSDGLAAQTEWRRRRAAERRTQQPSATSTRPQPTPTSDGPQPGTPQPAPMDAQPRPADPQPVPEQPVPELPAADQPSAKVIPFPQQPQPSKEDSVSTDINTEVIGLDQSIAYAEALHEFAAEHAPGGNEGYIGHLTERKVVGDALQSAHDMQAAFQAAAEVAGKHADELKRQKGVQEQYDANPDAGDKDFQQEGR